MKSHRRLVFLAGLLAAMLALPLHARAGRMEELQARFEQRFPKLRQLKDEGKIGETFGGLVEAVKDSDAKTGALLDEENTDRKELYELIAKNEKTTPQLVAERNARRNFEKAKVGDWLKGADGKWKRKAK